MHPDDEAERSWAIFHHAQAHWIHLVAAEHLGGTHWDFEVLDEDVSDPAGDFLVYVSENGGEDLRISIRCDPSRDDQPVRLHSAFNACFFGSPTLHWGDLQRSIWWSIGTPWTTVRPTAWEPAASEGFPYLPGRIDGRRHAPNQQGTANWVAKGRPSDIASTHPEPFGDFISADNEDLIPQWEEAYEINVQAMHAATDFVQAAGEIRKNLTYVLPRGLADWLSRTPEALRGDDELPEHIQAAADALEGLPAAILDDEAPDYYDGNSADFVRDAERIFRSVTRRLRSITPLQLLDPS